MNKEIKIGVTLTEKQVDRIRNAIVVYTTMHCGDWTWMAKELVTTRYVDGNSELLHTVKLILQTAGEIIKPKCRCVLDQFPNSQNDIFTPEMEVLREMTIKPTTLLPKEFIFPLDTWRKVATIIEQVFRAKMNQWGDVIRDLILDENCIFPDDKKEAAGKLKRERNAKYLLESIGKIIWDGVLPQKTESENIEGDIWSALRHAIWCAETGGETPPIIYRVDSYPPIQIGPEPLPKCRVIWEKEERK